MTRQEIKPLTMREILILYKIIGDFLPDDYDELDVLEYSHQIIDNVIKARSNAFVKALGFMAKITFDELLKMTDVQRVSLFVDCVYVNRLWLLKNMLRNIGYGTSKR